MVGIREDYIDKLAEEVEVEADVGVYKSEQEMGFLGNCDVF